MNWELVGNLIRLRYKLMWAKTRSRNGRIALFMIGYLLFVMVAILLGLGGFGAGLAAIKAGKAELMAQAVLSGLFVNSILTIVLLGFGLSAVFSETELRRYPLRMRERFLVRHFLGIADPFWAFILILELGLVLGLYAYGSYSLGTGVLAVLLLFLCGYLLTRVVAVWIDRLMNTRSGTMIVLMIIMSLSLLPGTMAQVLKKNPAMVQHIMAVLRFTPPFGAAAALTHTGPAMVRGLLMVGCWMCALGALLMALERRTEEKQRSARKSSSQWDSAFDRIAALFGPQMAPMVGHWLRFYVRNNRFRMLYLFSLPMAAFLTFNMGSARQHSGGLFVAALGAMPVVTFLGTSRIAVNQFGYVGGAFRRFFLFPTDPAACLRAASYTSLFLGSTLILPAAILWGIFAPRPLDPRMLLMPVLNCVAALFLFNGAGLWTTLYAAKQGKYDKSIGNDMSLAGNLAVVGTMLACVFLPMALHFAAPWTVSPDSWWLALLPAAAAMAFYAISLRGATAAFPAHRERLLAIVEGKA